MYKKHLTILNFQSEGEGELWENGAVRRNMSPPRLIALAAYHYLIDYGRMPILGGHGGHRGQEKAH